MRLREGKEHSLNPTFLAFNSLWQPYKVDRIMFIVYMRNQKFRGVELIVQDHRHNSSHSVSCPLSPLSQ